MSEQLIAWTLRRHVRITHSGYNAMFKTQWIFHLCCKNIARNQNTLSLTRFETEMLH